MPNIRTTTQTSHLTETEKAICLRVKEARQRLRLDQSEVVRRLGLKEHAISTIEKCRAPLRHEIALRFCREFLVNEQWLATGSYVTLENEAKRRGAVVRPGKISDLHPIFFRLTCDLWSEDITRTIPSRTLYSDAFTEFLAPVYDRLASQNFYRPRLKPNEHDTIDIFLRVFHASVDAGLLLLDLEARSHGEIGVPLQRQYLAKLLEASRAAFSELHGVRIAGNNVSRKRK